MARKRTRAREIALQFLYSVDGRAPESGEVDAFVGAATRDAGTAAFASALAAGCVALRTEIDVLLRASAGRELRAMAVVDRNVLRLGAYELLHRPDIPPPVTLNEAVELAKRYSTAKSGAFVNAVLDRIRREAGRPTTHAPVAPPGAAPPEPIGDTDETDDEGDFPSAAPKRSEA